MSTLPAPTAAQTIAVSIDYQGQFVQVFDVAEAEPFDVVVWSDTAGHSPSAAEFVLTEIHDLDAGILKVDTRRINDTPLDLGDNSRGEYMIAFRICAGPSSRLEIVRVTYFPMTADALQNQVLTLRGFQPNDSRPSSFGGEMGMADCDASLFPVTLGGADGGFAPGNGGSDCVVFRDGEALINPCALVVPATTSSFGAIKSRFQD